MITPQPERSLVSVIIPCRNEAEGIESCLASVLAQEEPEGGFEVIIADGMSEDGTRGIVERLQTTDHRPQTTDYRPQTPDDKTSDHKTTDHKTEVSGPWSVVGGPSPAVSGPVVGGPSPAVSGPVVSSPSVRVIDNPGKIVSTGLNAAIRAARGDIIIRMDAHTEYAPDYIRRCVETLRGTGADNAGGPWVAKGVGYISRAVAAAFQSPFAGGGARSHSPEYEGLVDSVYLGCWRREAFERFGYFDEELVRNQDDEHNLRIIRGGGRIWQNPEIKSWYRPRGSLSALFRQYLQYGYWKVRVIQKHKLPASWRHLVPGAFVLTLLVLFLLSAFSFLLSAFYPPSSVPGSLVGGPVVSSPVVRGPSSVPWPLGPWVPGSVVTGLVHFCFLLSTFCFVSSLVLYAFLASVASIATAARTEWKLLPLLPLVFVCYHFSYGWGFLRGVLAFLLLRRSAGRSLVRLTRTLGARTR